MRLLIKGNGHQGGTWGVLGMGLSMTLTNLPRPRRWKIGPFQEPVNHTRPQRGPRVSLTEPFQGLVSQLDGDGGGVPLDSALEDVRNQSQAIRASSPDGRPSGGRGPAFRRPSVRPDYSNSSPVTRSTTSKP